MCCVHLDEDAVGHSRSCTNISNIFSRNITGCRESNPGLLNGSLYYSSSPNPLMRLKDYFPRRSVFCYYPLRFRPHYEHLGNLAHALFMAHWCEVGKLVGFHLEARVRLLALVVFLMRSVKAKLEAYTITSRGLGAHLRRCAPWACGG